MALQGTFLADFSSFQAAVQKAEVSLKSFEGNAGKVETAVTRMANSLSGTKIVQEATIAAKAVESIGGVAMLTDKELQRIGATAAEAASKLRAMGQDVPPGIQKIADAAKAADKDTSGWMGNFSSQLKATMLGFISAQAVIGGAKMVFRELAQFVGDSVKAYAAQELAVKRMTTALQSQGQATPQVIQQYKGLATQFQNTSVFADELINEMQALLVQVGNVMPKDMEKALTAATDLASGLGIDLRTATMLVGKAFEGETGTLKRYGIVIDEAKLKAEGMPAVLEAIHQKFGGQAQAEIETYTGKVKQLENAWSDFQEQVGEVIVQDPFLQLVMKNAKEAITGVTDAAGQRSQRTLTDWWIILSGGLHSNELNLGLQILDEYLRRYIALNAEVRAMQAQLKSPNITTPTRPNQFGTDPLKGADLYGTNTEQLRSARRAVAELTIEQRKQIDAALLLGNATGLSTQELRVYQQQTKDAKSHVAALSSEYKKNLEAVKASDEAYAKSVATAKTYTTQMASTDDLLKKLSRGSIDAKHAQAELNGALHEGSEVWLDMARAMSIVPLSKMPGELIAIAKEVPKLAATLKDNLIGTLKSIPEVLASAFTGGGGLMGGIQAIATKIGSFIGSSIGMAIGGPMGATIGGALGSMAGKLTDFLKPLWHAMTEMSTKWKVLLTALVPPLGIATLFANPGRDLVKDFAESFGGFDAPGGLHDQLLTLGEAGEQLWIKLTQGVGRNNPTQARKVIAEIEEAFAKQGAAAEIAGVQTEEGAQATIETAAQAAIALDELNGRLKTNAEAWGEWSADVTGYLQKLADDIRSMPLPGPGGASGTGTVSGGAGMLHGGGGGGTTNVNMIVDGEVVARAAIRHSPAEFDLAGA